MIKFYLFKLNQDKLVIYKTKDNKIELKIHFKDKSVWLSQDKIAELFEVQRPAVTKHLKSIFKEGELTENMVSSILELTTKHGAIINKTQTKKVKHYNLDAIISVGYRINSSRATQFRIWATNVLRNYLVEGYVVNQKRLEQDKRKFSELQSQIITLRKVIDNETFTLDQSKELVRIIADYATGLDIINKVDHNKLELPINLTQAVAESLNYREVIADIAELRANLKEHALFGNEKDAGFKSSLKAIFQTFDGKDLYPSIEQKAANLLYLIIKNHPFTDGNKRIGSFMFIRFLNLNNLLYKANGGKTIEENTLVALALLIAQSNLEQKNIMQNLVVNLLANSNKH